MRPRSQITIGCCGGILGVTISVLAACSAATPANIATSGAIAQRTADMTACIAKYPTDSGALARACYDGVQLGFCAQYPTDVTCTDGGPDQ